MRADSIDRFVKERQQKPKNIILHDEFVARFGIGIAGSASRKRTVACIFGNVGLVICFVTCGYKTNSPEIARAHIAGDGP